MIAVPHPFLTIGLVTQTEQGRSEYGRQRQFAVGASITGDRVRAFRISIFA